MKKLLPLFLALLLLSGCAAPAAPSASAPATLPDTLSASAESPESSEHPETQPAAVPFPSIPLPAPEPVYRLSAEEKQMLLKLAMAERGNSGCMECTALVMQTVLNRVQSGRFGSTVAGVLFAPEQFTPVMDGTYDTAQPNELCYDALELLLSGWDESQGALYYEWCEGDSWHSQNLHLLFQHCNVRFYD